MNLMDVIAKAKAEKATSLDLSQQELRIVPPEVFEIDSLEELNLDRNKLVKLPDELGQLKNLKSLSVSENDLMELPDSIGNLTKLEHLCPASKKSSIRKPIQNCFSAA